AGRSGGGGFRRLYRSDGRLCARDEAVAGTAADRMFDERQCVGRTAGGRVRAALQPLSAYETDHAAEDPHELGDDERGNHGRAVCRRTGAPRGGADAGDRPMNADRPVIESLPEILVEPIVRAALAEDLGRAG